MERAKGYKKNVTGESPVVLLDSSATKHGPAADSRETSLLLVQLSGFHKVFAAV